MTTRRVLAGTVAFLCFALPAQAGEGWYLSLEGGANIVDDWEHTRTRWTICGPEIKEALAAFETGWSAFGAAGYALNGWRVEVEGGYRHNDIESYVKNWKGEIVREGGSRFDPSGELTEASLLINIIYDVPIFERFSISVGLGAGADFASFKLNTIWAPVDEDDWHFVYQGLAGVNYALTEMTVLFVNYRFANVSDVSFDPTALVHLEGEDFQKQAATAGVRFQLSAPGLPPAPPPAAPQPVPLEREFMVFFGFNKWSLSAEALSTIREAAGAVRASGSAAIRVVGHADRAGSIAYNKGLSLRRAKSVKKALIDEGLGAEAISISGRGESEPLVPTADGMRESQNRRVHISF
jgi:outer membrane protein OmpA-like peptidoglycan-associated protein